MQSKTDSRVYYWALDEDLHDSQTACIAFCKAWEDPKPIMVVSHAAYKKLKLEAENWKFLYEEELKKNQSLVNGNFGI